MVGGALYEGQSQLKHPADDTDLKEGDRLVRGTRVREGNNIWPYGFRDFGSRGEYSRNILIPGLI